MTSDDDAAAIRRVIDEFIAAFNRGDVDALVACYTEDLVKLRFQNPPETLVQTAERVRAFFASHAGTLAVVNDEILVMGDVAFTRGTLAIEAVPRAGGSPFRVERRFVELWRREADRWKVARTMDAAI